MNNNGIKFWTDNEEMQLVEEINNMIEIDTILKNHNRKITGILMRIEKIINDPIKSVKIFNKNEIIEKYLSGTKNKIFIHHEELYANILNYNSLDEISNNYNKLAHKKIISILNDFLKKKNIDVSKKMRIKCLLKSDDNLDFAEKVLVSNQSNNIEQTKTNFESNTLSIMISLLEEVKTMKTDIFDIKNRVCVIMDKVINFDNKTSKKKKKKKFLDEITENDKIENLEFTDSEKNEFNEINDLSDNILNIKNKEKKAKSKDINKQVEKIILSSNDKKNKTNKTKLKTNEYKYENNEEDDEDEEDEEELEKEFKKMIS